MAEKLGEKADKELKKLEEDTKEGLKKIGKDIDKGVKKITWIVCGVVVIECVLNS